MGLFRDVSAPSGLQVSHLWEEGVSSDPSQLCESHHRHRDMCVCSLLLPLSCQGGTGPRRGVRALGHSTVA